MTEDYKEFVITSEKAADGGFVARIRRRDGKTFVVARAINHEFSTMPFAVASRDDASRAVDEVLRLQRDGRANQLDVLEAERTLANAELSLAELRTGISADQIAIFLALGGGWQEPGLNAVAQK